MSNRRSVLCWLRITNYPTTLSLFLPFGGTTVSQNAPEASSASQQTRANPLSARGQIRSRPFSLIETSNDQHPLSLGSFGSTEEDGSRRAREEKEVDLLSGSNFLRPPGGHVLDRRLPHPRSQG